MVRETWEIRAKAIGRLMEALRSKQEAYGCANKAFPEHNRFSLT